MFYEESNFAAISGFLVFVAAAGTGLWALVLWINDRKFREAARTARVSAFIIVPYLISLAVTSLTTPRTIVNIGDSYCYDIWCVGVNQVNATPQGNDALYTADIRIFVDSSHAHHLPADQAKGFFYVLDDEGHRYSLLRDSSFVKADVTVHPGESVKSSLAFRAPASARKLYLIGNAGETFLPWVHLYFGSDISLFHRPALLRVL